MSFRQKTNRLAHLWGLAGLTLFVVVAVVLLLISIIEDNITARSLLVVAGFAAVGLFAYAVARFTGYLLVRVVDKSMHGS